MPLTDEQRHAYRLRDLMLTRRSLVSSGRAREQTAQPDGGGRAKPDAPQEDSGRADSGTDE